LIGKRIGCATLQPASNVWINGILQGQHGVPFRERTWVVEREEDAPFTPPPDLKIERLTRGTSVLALLLNGELSAIMLPQTPKPLLEGDPRIARLFPDYVPRERAYFKQTGIFPIMHVTAIKCDIVDRYPWVPGALFRAFVEAKQIAYRRMENVRIVTLPWFGAHWEDERALFGPDPWQYRADRWKPPDAGNRNPIRPRTGPDRRTYGGRGPFRPGMNAATAAPA
jgi:4,5-dihydroxyphthalate decarboxylase